MNDKKLKRKNMLETLAKLPKPIYEDFSYKIAQSLYKQVEWEQANVIGMTISKSPEVDTYQLIRKAWETEKKIVVPKCYPHEKKMSFRTLTEFSQLESVFYGLFEPMVDKTIEIYPDKIDLLIVPGLAYTREGYRLGFGGGYYDRFLSEYRGKTISLAFDSQTISQFPIEAHDVPVAKIITNNEVIKIE